MKLHEDKKLFNEAIRATAQRMDILDIYIEKDYWVCFALHTIFEGNFKDMVVFKGGTALSKCHQIIERFSEDIDWEFWLNILRSSLDALKPDFGLPGVQTKSGLDFDIGGFGELN